ncbi:MAG TPA: sulfite exporter TauE/SafE family protein [Deltaproteobacteria bacterium]|nr:sulfite exporter TauE/SafE family protein [Deltaproteobacteria bacterium]HQI80775.1 sulfite exporter TauE/SafE family protein [Deltaproteobacteria bacterium]
MAIPGDILILLGIGLAAGLLAGFFGIGGGVIIIPALIYILDYSQHRATGTSLAVLLPPVGIAAFIEYYRHGNVDIKAAIVIAAALIAGGWIGAYHANRLSGTVLRLAFGVFMTALGCSLVYGAARKMGWFS